jgi:hypothetical protein
MRSMRRPQHLVPVLWLLLALAAAAWPARARAAERGRWYGWQLGLADAAALALTLAPVGDEAQGATVSVGLTALFSNGATVGMVHRNPEGASLSLLRLPLFLGGRLLGFAVGNLFCQETGCKGPLLTAGSGFGLGIGMLLDHLHAFEPGPPPGFVDPSRPPPPPPVRQASPPPRRRPGAAPAYVLCLPLLDTRF